MFGFLKNDESEKRKKLSSEVQRILNKEYENFEKIERTKFDLVD